MSEKTLSIIKPDATSRNLIGEIISRFEKNGLKVVAAKWYSFQEIKPEAFMQSMKASHFLII